MPRTLVIGDIHGAFKALEQLVERLDPRRDDSFIFLGDYVDGWSESREVIEYLMNLEKSYECVFIKGNHDIWCEDWLSGKGSSQTWVQHGGISTTLSYARLGPREKNRHLDFFQRLLPYYEQDKQRLFLHAGFTSMHGPKFEAFPETFYWDRTLWELALALDDRIPSYSLCYPQRFLTYEEIYIGHTPTTNFGLDVPMHKGPVYNMDTGAGFSGKLTAMDVESKTIIQSDAVQTLYPDERGRNKE
jgi:serine/threonine protein phosphatase 1